MEMGGGWRSEAQTAVQPRPPGRTSWLAGGGLGRVTLGSGWDGVFQLPCLSPQLPWVCTEGTGSHVVLQGHIDCGSLLGHRAVYRMCFAMAAFFFLFSLLMICVRSSRDPRAAIQNG